MRIYVIDDEPIALNASEHVIHSAVPDAQITSFTSGDEALEVLNQTADYPDIVFSDVEMPGTGSIGLPPAFPARSPPHTKPI